MAGGHILVLQMQRLGDMIMSYPLLIWLTRMYPGQPLWVVGESAFYEGLLPVSPKAYYVPWTEIETLPVDRYDCIINLSHRPEAAALAGRLPSEVALGAVDEPDGTRRIRGDWQLYLASIVHNNRHNRFHFSELWALDAVPHELISQTRFVAPRVSSGEAVGLFLGASQEEKRPSAAFWAELARELDRRGHRPVLFGGPGETGFGEQVAALSGLRINDLCGRTTVSQLAAALGKLSLLITPDTGPMHLAAWTGTPVLNLSMGPVNPCETGPYPAGHHVLRSLSSCRGCWSCSRGQAVCRERFSPKTVALMARELALGRPGAGKVDTPGLGLFTTGRGENGLYDLIPAGARHVPGAADALDAFWSAAFFTFLGPGPPENAAAAFAALENGHPKTAAAFRSALPLLGAKLKRVVSAPDAAGDAFWKDVAPMLRPFAGFVQMLLHNGDFSKAVFARTLELLEKLTGFCRPA